MGKVHINASQLTCNIVYIYAAIRLQSFSCFFEMSLDTSFSIFSSQSRHKLFKMIRQFQTQRPMMYIFLSHCLKKQTRHMLSFSILPLSQKHGGAACCPLRIFSIGTQLVNQSKDTEPHKSLFPVFQTVKGKILNPNTSIPPHLTHQF